MKKLGPPRAPQFSRPLSVVADSYIVTIVLNITTLKARATKKKDLYTTVQTVFISMCERALQCATQF